MPEVLKSYRLYIGDNGRVFCGLVNCAGASATFTGRTISGQEVQLLAEIMPADGWSCASCGRTDGDRREGEEREVAHG